MLRSPTTRLLLSLLLLTMAVLVTFGSTLRNNFVDWDDRNEIFQNPDFNPVTADSLLWNWTHTRLTLYMPVTYMVWGVDAAISARDSNGTLKPIAFHAMNLTMHAICSILVFLLIRQVWKRDGPALMGALLFAVHPLQVEPVAWASGMYTLLSAAFSLSALLAYFAASAGRRAWGWFWLASALYIAALLSKAASVSLPLVAGVIDILIIGHSFRQSAKSLWLWMMLGIPVVLLAKYFQDVSSITSAPWWARPIVALDAIGFYLRKLAVPINLIPDYGRNPSWVMQHEMFVMGSAAIAVGVLMVAWFTRRRAAWITAGICMLVAGIFPYLGLTEFDFQYVSTVADRYVYFGMVGVAFLVAGAVMRSRIATIISIMAAAICSVLSFQQMQRWTDTNTLFNYTLSVNSRSLVSHNIFGYIAARQHRSADAEAHYLTALQIWPEDATIQFNLGNLYFASQPEKALERYALAVKYQPRYAPYRNSLAAALDRDGHPAEAFDQWKQTLADDPDYIDARNNLADMLARRGRLEEARTEYLAVIKIDPNNAHAGGQLAQMGRMSVPTR